MTAPKRKKKRNLAEMAEVQCDACSREQAYTGGTASIGTDPAAATPEKLADPAEMTEELSVVTIGYKSHNGTIMIPKRVRK